MRENLEIGKDYVSEVNGVIVIDRIGVSGNRGFFEDFFVCNLVCSNPNEWREAAEEEVIEAFKKHLSYRFGEDWRTMEIRERHPASLAKINDGSWNVEISKLTNGWGVRNKNGLLYYNGIWVDRLGESKIHIKEAIKENTVIHCETEGEAERILNMAHKLGYKWCTGRLFRDVNNWDWYKDYTCYYLFKGTYDSLQVHNRQNHTIIPSIQIADLEHTKSSDWVLAPEEIEEIKAGEKVDNRYALKRDVLTILSVESKLNPDKKISEYLEQFRIILEVL